MSESASSAAAVRLDRRELEAFDQRVFGFWLYLMRDAILFALLFMTYVVMVDSTAGGPGGRELFDPSRAFAETMLLLFSSLTFGFASLAARARQQAGVLGWLFATFVLGLAFLIMELGEFREMVSAGAGPGRSGFLSAFFTLVGAHGLHVGFGLFFIAIMGVQIAVRGLTAPASSRLFRLGLFWHLLDIVWIGIFSVVYLPGVL